MQHDYDEVYDTKVSRPFGNSRIGFIFGPLFVFLGIVALVMSITDVYRGIYNLNQQQTNNLLVYTWDENPIWPTYGKGFWVGLILIGTGVVGIIASCEHTVTSAYSFSVLSAISAGLSFYLLISAIVPVQKLSGYGSSLFKYESITLGLNSVLMAVGALGLIVGTVSSILTGILVGCCTERRGYGASYLDTIRNPALLGVRNEAFD